MSLLPQESLLNQPEKLPRPYFESLNAKLPRLQAEPHLVLELELESYSQFQCTLCGDCCRLPWGIHVSKSYYDQWYAVFDQHPSGRFRAPFEVNQEPKEQAYASIRRQPGTATCVFLESDNSCFIHKNYGEAALSLTCVKYPRMERDFGPEYASRSLLHSCTAAPELLESWPDLIVCFKDSRLTDNLPLALGPGQPNRWLTYLWLGLALDLLDAPQPDTVLARWRLMLPVIDWMDAIGLQTLRPEQMPGLYYDLMARLPFAGLQPSAETNQRQALDWSLSFLSAHPGAHTWLNEIRNGHEAWPELDAEERVLLDRQLGAYLRSRLLSVPYTDMFLGELSFWQQLMVLGIQTMVLQWLALYYRRQSGGELTREQLHRAVNAIAYRFEQRSKMVTEFRLNSLSPEQAYQALGVLLSLNFAEAQLWSLGL